MRILITAIVLFLFSGVSDALAVPGTLSGGIEYRYAQYKAEEAGTDVLDASHFVQKYSLLWEKEGRIRKGRAGFYSVALGYEWSWIDSEIEGQSVAIENPLDKIIFKGDVLLAPKGLPFRLNLYSRDLSTTSFVYDELGELFVNNKFNNQRGLITSIHNGSHIETGMTLMAGVKNGKAYGKYRDIFAAMPRLLIDFKQNDVRDVKGPDAIHYRDRNLAFVSLNKSKNWFHYRFFTHEDFLDPEEDFESQTYLLGTIDHVNRRQWIDLTNWIQLSTDISYSETTPNARANQSQQKRYDINIFATARRDSWNGSTYASYNRVRDDRTLEKFVDVPFFADGRLSRETRWRVRFENRFEEKDVFSTGVKTNENNQFMSARLDMFTQSRYMVSPLLELEYKEGTDSDGHGIRLGAEFYNNPRYRSGEDLFGSYHMTAIGGETVAGETISYIEQQLVGRYATDYGRDFRVGGGQEITYGSGSLSESGTNFISSNIAVSTSDSLTSFNDGSYFRSISNVFMDHRPANRIYNRLELAYDYLSYPADSSGQLTILHNLNYYGRLLKLSMDNELILGNSLHDSFEADVDVVSSSGVIRQTGIVDKSFVSRSRLDYDPDRRHSNRLNFAAEWREFETGGSDQRYDFVQSYSYTFWKESGLSRKVALLGEEVEYEDYTPSFGESSSVLSFTLFSELYPTRQTLLSAKLRYEIDTVDESDTMLVFLTAGIDFKKFQMEFDYAYGTRTAGINEPERVEHKWEMKVKKIF